MGIPDETEFATKPQLVQAMISRAVAAGVLFAWFTADGAHGQAKWLHAWLEEHGVSYVMAIRRSDTLTTADGEQRADTLIAALGPRSWQKIPAGAGAHGPREYHWAWVRVRLGWERGRGHWLLARRSLTSPDGISYYACYGPRRSSTADLAWAAGSRWHIEECFQQAKGETGLDHYQVRTWRLVRPHHLVDARPGLAGRFPRQRGKRGTGTSDPGVIGYTLAEIRRLVSKIGQQQPGPEHAWSWSRWRRKRQYQARICHYQRRGYASDKCAAGSMECADRLRQLSPCL